MNFNIKYMIRLPFVRSRSCAIRPRCDFISRAPYTIYSALGTHVELDGVGRGILLETLNVVLTLEIFPLLGDGHTELKLSYFSSLGAPTATLYGASVLGVPSRVDENLKLPHFCFRAQRGRKMLMPGAMRIALAAGVCSCAAHRMRCCMGH